MQRQPNFESYLSSQKRKELLYVLHGRFQNTPNRHEGLEWGKVQAKLESNPQKPWSLSEMERTGGEPDLTAYGKATD